MTRFHFFREIDFTEKFMHLLIQDYVHLKDHLLIEIGFRVDKSFFFSFLVFSLSVKETNGDFLGLGRGELLKLAPPKYSRKRKIKKKKFQTEMSISKIIMVKKNTSQNQLYLKEIHWYQCPCRHRKLYLFSFSSSPSFSFLFSFWPSLPHLVV